MSARDAMRTAREARAVRRDDRRRRRRVPGSGCRARSIEAGAVCRLVLERAQPRRTGARGPAMTWADLHAALRGATASIRAGDGARADAAEAVVTAIAYRLAACRARATCSSRSRASMPTAPSFARQAIERGAVAVVSEQPAPAGTDVPWVVVDGRAAALWRSSPTPFYGHPSARHAGRRHHRHQRQDDDGVIWWRRFSKRRTSGAACSARSATASATRSARRRTRRPKLPKCRRLLREMADRGCGACAMEVSSHALVASSRGRDRGSPPACSRT